MAELKFDSHSAQYFTRDKGYRPTVTDKAVTHINFIQGGYRTVLSSSDIANLHFNLVDEGQIIYAISEAKTYKISKTHAAPLQGIFESISYEEFYFPTLTSSFATTASYIDTASYAITASYIDTASYALTASHVLDASGVGFPYSGSDTITDSDTSIPSAAVITGSLFLSGSGFITASKILTTKLRAVGGDANGIAGGGFNIETQWLNAGAVYSSHLESFNNTNVCGDLNVSGSANIDTDLNVTGSANIDTNLNVSGNLDIGGTLSFDGFNFSDGNISILSGSNIFGTSSLNTHQFTGSLLVSGGPHLIQGDAKFTGDTQLTGSLSVSGSFSVFEGKPPSNFSSQMFPNPYKIFDVNTNNEETTVYKLQAEGPNHDFRGYEGPVPDNLADIGVTFNKETKVTITGSLDISGSSVGAILINGNPLDFSGIEDQEVFVAHVMINTGDLGDGGLILEDANDFDSSVPVQRGNANNQIAISSSETPAVQLVPGDKVKIKWVYNNVSHSHTTHIFDVREDDSTTGLADVGILANNPSPFKWLSSYENLNPVANDPPYKVKYIGYDFDTNSSMSLHTGITASHWINIVSQSTFDYVEANGPIQNFEFPPGTITNVFDNTGIINTSWIANNRPGLHQTFKLFKIIPGVPCCNVFGSEITVHGGITTVDGPIRANGELISEQGLIVKVPHNPNFHNPDKYNKDRDLEIPMMSVKSGSVTPIEINDQGILKIHSFDTPTDGTPDFTPHPFKGGFMFRNNELYIGKE